MDERFSKTFLKLRCSGAVELEGSEVGRWLAFVACPSSQAWFSPFLPSCTLLHCLCARFSVLQDNFENWGIVIKVSFRSGAPLQPLSPSTQSGGEQSVTTMLYLTALQSLTTVCWRLLRC